MFGDVQNEKRRNPLPFGDVGNGGIVAVFGGVISEFFAVAKFGGRFAMGSPAGFRGFDDGGHIVGVAIDGNAAFDEVEREAFGFDVAIVDTDEGGELGAGGMAHDEHAPGIAAVFGNVIVDPANGFCDVAEDGDHFDVRQDAVAGGDENESFAGEGLRFGFDAGFIAGDPASAVNPKNDRKIFGIFWGV